MAECDVCGRNPAPYEVPSKLTPEQQEIVRAYYESFKDGTHTGHLPPALLELPTHLCEEHKPVSEGA